MTKQTTFFGILLILLTQVVPASAADRDVARTRISARYVGHMHYYAAYPWWWHQPYVHRARTNYQPWPFAVRDPDYDRPHPDGVVGWRIF